MSEKQLGKRPQQMLNNLRAPPPFPPPNCPRCYSGNTKFCYYNNYSVSQPRYFCKDCRRYWTHGGVIRNIPSGGTDRKRGRHDFASSSSQSSKPPPSGHLVSPPPPPPPPTTWSLGSPYNNAHVGLGSNVVHDTFRQPSIGGGFFNQTLSNSNSGGLNTSFGAVNVVFGGEAPPTQAPPTIVSPNFSSVKGFNDLCFPFLQRQQFQPQLCTPSSSSIWAGQNMVLNNNNNNNNNNTLTSLNNTLHVARDSTSVSNVNNLNEWSELNDMENEGDPLQSYKPSSL